MLLVYFDTTKAWLAKLARVPLLSVLQEPKADLDISRRSLLGAMYTKGLTTKFGAILNRKSAVALEPKFLKLKVRVKGLIDALIKSTEKKDIPGGIIDFLRRISSDGVYFPSEYFSIREKEALEFDSLGGTRNMHLCVNLPNGRFCSRLHLVLLNFLLVRILIPQVILQPWSAGIGVKSTKKQILRNLKNMATLLYLICNRISYLEKVFFFFY